MWLALLSRCCVAEPNTCWQQATSLLPPSQRRRLVKSIPSKDRHHDAYFRLYCRHSITAFYRVFGPIKTMPTEDIHLNKKVHGLQRFLPQRCSPVSYLSYSSSSPGFILFATYLVLKFILPELLIMSMLSVLGCVSGTQTRISTR